MRLLKILLMLTVASVALGGCLNGDSDDADVPGDDAADGPGTPGPIVTDRDGQPVGPDPGEGTPDAPTAPPALPLSFALRDVGEPGPEPSVGVTSSGCIFFSALEKVMRSCDHGGTWEAVQDPNVCQDGTSDPYLWVDPDTDRIFNVQMVSLVTSWICWSDDDGETWLGNPHDSGPVPVNDHIKIGTGPWTDMGYGLAGGASPAYENAVYFCYNKLAGVFCYTSVDGGATFTLGGQGVGVATTGAGLHGAITTAPDGTVYVPPRVGTPTVLYSKDNGFSWTTATMGEDAGTPNPRKNSEVATDSASNAYHTWIGGDFGVYLARSTDSGVTWDQESLRVSPVSVVSSTFPHIDAGDPGRIALTYLGSADADVIDQPDIDGNNWTGNPHYAPENVSYHLYVSYSLNALDDEPTFTTVRVTDDPVQVGSICISSGDCRDLGGSNRNLLDFNDLHIDSEGRVFIAYADGCTDNGEEPCASDPDAQIPANSRDRRGMLAYLESGPSLYESVGDLTPFTA